MGRNFHEELLKQEGKSFYLLNERAEVFAGLKRGFPFFSPNWEDGKPLTNDNQVKIIKKGDFKSLIYEKCYV